MEPIRNDDEIDALKVAAMESLARRGMSIVKLSKTAKFTAGYEAGLVDAFDWLTGDTDVNPYDFLPEDVPKRSG